MATTPVLQRLNLRIDPDDRIALLGRNGNGKTTLARLLAAQLAPMDGEMHASGKMRVGYFTQYQVEELARRRHAARAHDPGDEGQDARRGARAARPVRLLGRQGDDRWSASCRAASARGWRWR